MRIYNCMYMYNSNYYYCILFMVLLLKIKIKEISQEAKRKNARLEESEKIWMRQLGGKK